eukprot:2465549-Pyramimonas_sp.AAC.2
MIVKYWPRSLINHQSLSLRQVSEEAVAYFKRLGTWEQPNGNSAGKLDMLFVHGDYVTPQGVPPGLSSMGGTALSPHNGLFNGANILTFQGHAEFDTEAVEVCIEKLSEREVLPNRLPPGTTIEQVCLGTHSDTRMGSLHLVISTENKGHPASGATFVSLPIPTESIRDTIRDTLRGGTAFTSLLHR